MLQSDDIQSEPRGRGRPRKNQETFKFKPPVYNSPLGYQYTQPILFSSFVQQPPKLISDNENFGEPPKPKRSAAIQGVQAYKKRKKQATEDSSFSSEEDAESTEPDIYEKLLDRKEDESGVKYLVKYRNCSYLHCEWVEEEEILKTRVGAMKAKRYKYIGILPEHITVDRIIQEQSNEDQHTVLVKWKGLSYEFSTFELFSEMEECENFEKKLAAFRDRKRMRHMRFSIDWRPPKDKQLKFEESPVFKKENKLRPYQLEGLNWLLNRWYFRQSCIMADEMGLGKTVQSVSFVNALYCNFDYYTPALVVAPLSTIGHWEREFANWTDLRVITYHGSIEGRRIIADYEFQMKSGNMNVRLFDVIITTYEMVIAGLDHLGGFEFGVGIFDEAHRLKNPASKASLCLKSLQIHHKVLLSGTPIQNNLNELWALFNFIDPIRFNNVQSFLSEYKMESGGDVDKLQELLKPLMLRRMKEDVETSIPSKEETIIEVELTTIQKRYYRAILEKNIEFLTNGDKKNAPNLINAMMELRKCCIHPYLLKGAEDSIISDYNSRKLNNLPISGGVPTALSTIVNTDEYYDVLIHSSGKLVLLDKLLNKLQGNHKVLIFSQMTKCLDLLSEYLQYRQFKFERIDGGVKGDLRQAAIDRFSSGDAFVFLLCTRAGGVGINLTAADTCIIFDSDWNPQNDLQAQARCHRIGQKKQVKIYRLITKNSYEREMFDKAGMKLGLDRAVLQKMSFNDHQIEKTNKKEDAIQLLLRKGAYGVLMDTDDDANKFCEEDIDQILERRTKVIKHEDGGNAFSKATFQVEKEIEDPHFWENLLTHKKKEEKEGRVKRQCRKLARDGNIEDSSEIRGLYAYYSGSLPQSSSMTALNEKETELFVMFLDILCNGLENLDFDLYANNLEGKAIILGHVVHYCLDLISNEKIKMDFMEFIEKFNIDYDVELFEKMSNVYLKYHEAFLFRIQVPMIIYSLKDDAAVIDKGRGFTHEDDKMIIKNIIEKGYDNFTIRDKSVEDVNQRVRKIINVLYHRKEIKDNDNLYFKAILNFGRVTEMNQQRIAEFIQGEINKLNEIVDRICNMTRRARRETSESDCYDRIVFFDKLASLKKVIFVRKSQVPRNWNEEKDSQVRDFLLREGFVNLYQRFGVTEDVIIKRFEQMFKFVSGKEENE